MIEKDFRSSDRVKEGWFTGTRGGWNVSDCHMTATRLEFFSFIPRPNFSQVGQSDPRKIWFGNETRNISVRSL